MEPIEILWFVFLGLLGGLTYIVMESESWNDLITYNAFKRYLLGAIVGFLYNILHSEYSYPNSMMCFVSGYAGTTFIESLSQRYARSKKSDINV